MISRVSVSLIPCTSVALPRDLKGSHVPLVLTGLQGLLQPGIQSLLQRRVARHPIGLIGMIEGIGTSAGQSTPGCLRDW